MYSRHRRKRGGIWKSHGQLRRNPPPPKSSSAQREFDRAHPSGRKRRYRRTAGTVNGCRTAAGRSSDGRRTVVGGARVVSGAEKKSFDRGGPVWPPRSNVTNDRLRGGSGGALPPQPKIGGSGGQRPPAKNISKIFEKKKIFFYFF